MYHRNFNRPNLHGSARVWLGQMPHQLSTPMSQSVTPSVPSVTTDGCTIDAFINSTPECTFILTVVVELVVQLSITNTNSYLRSAPMIRPIQVGPIYPICISYKIALPITTNNVCISSTNKYVSS